VITGLCMAFMPYQWINVLTFGLLIVVLLVRPRVFSKRECNGGAAQTEKKNRTCVFLAIGVVLLLSLFPLLSPPAYFLSMLYMVFLYVILAESWNIIGGYAGYLSFGHVAFFGLGAYTTAFLMTSSPSPRS